MPPHSYDIFCRVVDNFGDAAVCWRLARQLSLEHGAKVRLWIDKPATLERLVPASASERTADNVEIHAWQRQPSDFKFDNAVADVVVEAFGCGLPDEYVVAMLGAPRSPVWIVLEYLSGEAWTSSHHGLPSPHPRYRLQRYFFFPGFTSGTGGLLRESDLLARRDMFRSADREAFWNVFGHSAPSAGATVVSLFAYDDAPVIEWLDIWSSGSEKTIVVIPEGTLCTRAVAHLGGNPADALYARGALEIRVLPFLSQTRYDELLWSCDVNFVRGEDSFVRAQWAGRPFVWNVYPQEGDTHRAKLEAFLKLYCEAADPETGVAIARVMTTWNRLEHEIAVDVAWRAFAERRHAIEQHARKWAARLETLGDLAGHLAQFCRGKLK